MMTLQDAERFEMALQGQDVKICQDVNCGAGYEPIEFEYSEVLASINPAVRQKLEENKAEAERAHAYFMYGEDLHEAMNNLSICALQPQSEDALERIQEGVPVREDFLARNFVAICIFEVPEEEFNNWRDQGLLATQEGNENYETLDGERVELSEAVLGDVAIKRAIESGYLKYFGQSHEVYKAVGLDEKDFDPYNVFDRSFVTQSAVGINILNSEKNSDALDNPYRGTELEGVYMQIVNADISKFDKQSLIDTLEYTKSLPVSDRALVVDSIHDTLSQMLEDNENSM